MRWGDCSNKVSCDITNSSISEAGIRTRPACWFFRILDHSLGDVVTIPSPLLRRVRGRKPIAVLVIEQTHQQALFGRSRALPWRLKIGLELCLHLVPHLLIDDRGVLARVGSSLMGDLAQINPVVQDQIESTARVGSSS